MKTKEARALAVRAPDFPPGLEWIGGGPVRLADLRGRLVLLHFWTYGCINCQNVLPELSRLDARFRSRGLTILEIHAGKFDAERSTEAIRLAARRLGVHRPVANDARFLLWQAYAVRAWPTLVFVDPLGQIVGRHEGEFAPAEMERVVTGLLERYRRQGLLRPGEGPPLPPAAGEPPPRGLAFPGRVLPDGDRIWLSDTGHGRVLAFDRSGRLLRVIDGLEAPQGLLRLGESLWIADPVAGTLWRAPAGEPGPAEPYAEGLRQPWDLAGDGETVWVAMAGAHQIWRFAPPAPPRPWAGLGWEGLRDGDLRGAFFAQPSGLAFDGRHLWVADSEASAIRRVDVAAGRVETVAGSGLFDFGDSDGGPGEARLPHPLAVAWDARRSRLLVADTYNGKVRRLEPASGRLATLASGLHEPGGLAWDPEGDRLFVCDTNDHALRLLHPEGGGGAVWSHEMP